MLKISKPPPERKTWVAILKEAWRCKDKEEAKEWLEKEALLFRRRNQGYTLAGAKFIIRMNLGALAEKYGAETVKQVKKNFGAVHPVYGRGKHDL